MADPGRMVALVREQADGCAALGSPLYAVLLQHVADDVEGGGPAYDVLRGHEDDPGPSALALRLMGWRAPAGAGAARPGAGAHLSLGGRHR